MAYSQPRYQAVSGSIPSKEPIYRPLPVPPNSANETQLTLPESHTAAANDIASPKMGKGKWPFTGNEMVNFVIQLVSLIAAITFGIWAVKSYNAALRANYLSSVSYQSAQSSFEAAQNALYLSGVANRLALLSFCASNTVSVLYINDNRDTDAISDRYFLPNLLVQTSLIE